MIFYPIDGNPLKNFIDNFKELYIKGSETFFT